MRFHNRVQAGQELAIDLSAYAGREDVILLALPRGGVPVAAEVARALDVPLDVMLVRKLGLPGQEELAIGAISMGGLCVLNENIVRKLNLGEAIINQVIAREQAELIRRNQLYRKDRPMPDLVGKTVIVIDDGLATGATMQAAVSALKKTGASEIIAAVPVGAAETCCQLETQVDKVVCLYQPAPFLGVGRWYSDFTQVSDDVVKELLEKYIPNTENPETLSNNDTTLCSPSGPKF